MTNNEQFGKNLLDYINTSPTAFHAVLNAGDMLKKAGFTELSETERWNLGKGKYFIKRNNSSLIAFETGTGDVAENGFHIIGAHTDSPTFKIKPGGCKITNDGHVKLNTETYGGAILSTWFDRPLSIAGRVWVKTSDGLEERIIDLQKPILMIPNLCIHFQRDVNESNSYNKQIHVMPLLGFAREEVTDYLPTILADHMKIDKSGILDYELYLYECDKGILMGIENEFISASRLDNLSMVYCGLRGLIESECSSSVKVLAAFDNEEVGSATIVGADSSYITNTIKRICTCLGADEQDYYRAIANSMVISADTGHAVHPNYDDKHDPLLRPVLGGGPTIKYSASQRYATNAQSAAYFMDVCDTAKVPYQQFAIRSDMVGGSTIGPAMSSALSISAVDVGTSILAMHSVREFGCVVDNVYTATAFKQFYNGRSK